MGMPIQVLIYSKSKNLVYSTNLIVKSPSWIESGIITLALALNNIHTDLVVFKVNLLALNQSWMMLSHVPEST